MRYFLGKNNKCSMNFSQIKQLQAQVREAENRADQMDQDKERMEFVLEQVCTFFTLKLSFYEV